MLSTEAYQRESALSGSDGPQVAYIGPSSQAIYPNDDDEYIEDHPTPAPDQTSLSIKVRSVLCPTHSQIRDPPEYPAKEGVKQRAHERQKVREEGNDLRDDEGHDPSGGENSSPGRPADDGMIALVARVFEDAKEDEAGRDGGIEDAEEDEGRDHEGERDFLVELVAKRSKCRCGVVLCAGVHVDDYVWSATAKGGLKMICLPAPTRLKTTVSATVTSHRAFLKSYGFFISAMKLGRVIWPMKV